VSSVCSSTTLLPMGVRTGALFVATAAYFAKMLRDPSPPNPRRQSVELVSDPLTTVTLPSFSHVTNAAPLAAVAGTVTLTD
jgi:hypothetical protein